MIARWSDAEGKVYEMVEITLAAMDELLSDEKRRELLAFPFYFDSQKRIWPLPCGKIHVDFSE